MYMDETLLRLGCLNYVQNVYKLLLLLYTKPVYYTSENKTMCKLVSISLNKLKVDNWKMKGEI